MCSAPSPKCSPGSARKRSRRVPRPASSLPRVRSRHTPHAPTPTLLAPSRAQFIAAATLCADDALLTMVAAVELLGTTDTRVGVRAVGGEDAGRDGQSGGREGGGAGGGGGGGTGMYLFKYVGLDLGLPYVGLDLDQLYVSHSRVQLQQNTASNTESDAPTELLEDMPELREEEEEKVLEEVE